MLNVTSSGQMKAKNTPSCKYPYNDGYAPCEIEDQEKETEDWADQCLDELESLMDQNADVLKRLKEN